jgi:hypothetical protein
VVRQPSSLLYYPSFIKIDPTSSSMGLSLVVLFKWLMSTMDLVLVVLFKWLMSSMDLVLVVLFKWLRSSIHVRLCICLGTYTLVVYSSG